MCPLALCSKAGAPFGRGASVGSQEEMDGIEGFFVGFALALDSLVEFRVGRDVAELERHGEAVACYAGNERGEFRVGK